MKEGYGSPAVFLVQPVCASLLGGIQRWLKPCFTTAALAALGRVMRMF